MMLQDGQYYGPDGFLTGATGKPVVVNPRPLARNDELAVWFVVVVCAFID